jgi:hypothetical protein
MFLIILHLHIQTQTLISQVKAEKQSLCQEQLPEIAVVELGLEQVGTAEVLYGLVAAVAFVADGVVLEDFEDVGEQGLDRLEFGEVGAVGGGGGGCGGGLVLDALVNSLLG